ncbi:hypothetical protein [Dokdonella sp.]|uniref:hypothetical protein n=1 Tax=Dokdonella sp. TaxID=2291710 RepID=UPI003783E81D
MRFFFLLAGVFAVSAALPLRAAEISVGADASCTAHTIDEALALAAGTPEVDTIRLANDQAYAGLALDIHVSVNLVGGHTACGDTQPVGATHLEGSGSWATVSAFGPTAEGVDVRLEHLDISGGGIGGDIGSFGGLAVEGNSRVHVADVALHNNRAIFGGGIGVFGAGARLVLERNVDIHDNEATFTGGGLYVEMGTANIRPQAVSIHDNLAQSGGGLAIASGQVNVGSDIDDQTTPITGFLIARNNAAGNGGGVFVTGQNGMLLADDTVIRDNQAVEGGGVFASTGGYAQLASFPMGPFRHCAPSLECLRVSGNQAMRGGGVAVRNGGTAHLSRSIVRANTAARGSALSIADEASMLRGLGLLVVQNHCDASQPQCDTIGMSAGTARFQYATFADNDGRPLLLFGDGVPGNSRTTVSMDSTLVSGKPMIFGTNGAAATFAADCVMKDSGTLEGGMGRSDIGPILFQDRARGDYRLVAGNRAIDYCDDTHAPVEDPDLDGTPRGIEGPGANDLGRYDLGAYEFDRIFASGIETAL